MSRYDATQSNESKRSAKFYRDLDLDFQINSATKDIQKLSDIEAVKRSVRNLINTNHYERPFHPEIGSNLRPRCRLVQLNVQPDVDRNGYRASISFFVINHPERVEVETFLERLR